MMQNRPPIVVILGHVDHGKTSLLDFLRKSNITDSEVGGITQSTRAFQVGGITFIDTPGHAAFSAMRQRGKNIADIAILLVAADDGVMPQTKEAAKLLLDSQSHFVVAINKIDLPGANVQKVYTQLSEIGVLVEGFGGTIPVVSISAKTGTGIPELLEMLDLLASLNHPQADPDGELEAAVLESRLDAKRGSLAIVVVKNGTLKIGQELFLDRLVGKAKAIITTQGETVSQAGPSLPVEILGLSEVLPVGSIIGSQINKLQVKSQAPTTAPGVIKLILKADVLGSLEAILASLNPQAEILISGTGEISESDILAAAPLDIPVIGFNVRISGSVAKLAEIEKVKIKTFNIIYELLDYVDLLVQKALNPRAHEKIVGEAEIAAEFDMNNTHVAGCKCAAGVIAKSDQLHLLRNGEIIQDLRIRDMKSGKSDIGQVKAGGEFGCVFSGKVDFKIGDRIIAYTTHD